jgi:hypothetical protein
MTRKLSAVPPTTNDPPHTLTIDQVDELSRLHRTMQELADDIQAAACASASIMQAADERRSKVGAR